MDKELLRKLSFLVSKKLDRETVFISGKKIGHGYHSDGFKLSTSDDTHYFLKYLRSHDLGFEYPERKMMSLMVSNGMGQRVKNETGSVGVIIMDGEHELILPELTDNLELFHLQEFAGSGISYSEILIKNIKKNSVDEEDIRQLSSIADMLINIHSTKHTTKDLSRLTAIYNDGLRGVLTHPELSIMALSEFPDDYPILNLEEQKEIISLMFDNLKRWIDRPDRLCALHGDFWGTNIFFRENGSVWVIDFSRIPWGDPGIDVGWFISQYLWYYHLTGNIYFKELTETWFKIYEEKSGDKEIRKAVTIMIGWSGIVQIYPKWFPNIDPEVGKKFINHIKEILRAKEFKW